MKAIEFHKYNFSLHTKLYFINLYDEIFSIPAIAIGICLAIGTGPDHYITPALLICVSKCSKDFIYTYTVYKG